MEEYNFDNFKQYLRLKGFSNRTIISYLYYNNNLLKLARKTPRNIAEKDIKNYLDYLVLNINASVSTVNIAYSALKSYYWHVYKNS